MRADYVLYYKPGIPLAVVEAKDNNHTIGQGMQQALDYATTSKLLNTGVDARPCKLIVIDQRIESMTTFKQIIGRGTRILEEYNKTWFTIMDFKGATRLFRDDKFDGPPGQIYEPAPDDPPTPDDPDGPTSIDPGPPGPGREKLRQELETGLTQ